MPTPPPEDNPFLPRPGDSPFVQPAEGATPPSPPPYGDTVPPPPVPYGYGSPPPPPPPYAGPQGYGVQGYGGQGYVPAGYAPPASTNGMAVASLVLGVIGVISCGYTFFLAPLLAVIFAVLGRRQIRETGQRGEGLATAGLVLGIIGLVISALIVIFVIGAIVSSGGSATSG